MRAKAGRRGLAIAQGEIIQLREEMNEIQEVLGKFIKIKTIMQNLKMVKLM